MKKIAIILPLLLLLGRLVNAQAMVFTRHSIKYNAHGSRYFFSYWVHGFLIDNKDSLIKKPDYFFNYDKIGGGLVMAYDNKSVIAVNKRKIKSFTMFNRARQAFVFELVPAIDTGRYVQVLSLGAKYKVYKLTKTEFTRASYSNDGITRSGNNYDEYIDDNNYYVLNVGNNQLQKISLKKKALETAFANDADKLNKFMADHSSDTIGDIYLTSLGDYMNN